MSHTRKDSLSPEREDESTVPFLHDVIIIGAGPCGLAVAARLREQTPSALFTDEEHARYHWISKNSVYAAIKNSKTGRTRGGGDSKRRNPSMLVLDSSSNQWMSKWDRLFDLMEIEHLRSPMFFHPDPQDRDGLLAYVHKKKRQDDCIEISGCVGKEISKHGMKKRRQTRHAEDHARPLTTIDERDRKDYFCPPTDVFRKYCRSIVERYCLFDADLIRQVAVIDIDYDISSHFYSDQKVFSLRTNKQSYFARNVVLAIGAGNSPLVPRPFTLGDCKDACHAFQRGDEVLLERLRQKKPTNIVVIGGGLTSAQVVDRAIRQGASKVFHLLRGPLKVKPFDVDLSWMGKFRNHEKASFWSADTDGERLEMIKHARGGGSITSRFMKVLHRHAKTTKLSLHPCTVVSRASHNAETHLWSLETLPPIDLPEIHFVYFATGAQSDFGSLPCLEKMIEKYPLTSFDGFPALTDDLRWREDVPLFVTGKFASLRLGPGAGNLEGARVGAERIAWALQESLERADECQGVAEVRSDTGMRYATGVGSRFEALDGLEDSPY